MNRVKDFWRDESGVILPYVSVMFMVFIGLMSFAIDAARLTSLQTQLQKAADAFAIAGAAELDRFPSSTTRANNAIANMLTNYTLNNATTGNVPVTVQSVRFLENIPASDTTPTTAPLCTGGGCTANQSGRAAYVEVVVNPANMTAIFPLPLINNQVAQTLATGASAVAGMNQIACQITPMFICNPFEQPGDSYEQATARIEAADADPSFRSKVIRLADSTAPGASGTFGPGDFGYLKPEPGTLPSDSCFPAGQEIAKAMASNGSQVCVRQNGVDLLPGNPTGAIDGLNTRFGKYGNSFNGTCRQAYPPDVNTRTGWVPQGGGAQQWCRGGPDGTTNGAGINWPPATPLANSNPPLPADACLLGTSNCSPVANIGSSTWNCLAYWNAAHSSGVAPPAGCTATATISRYDVYLDEITRNINDTSTRTSDAETTRPQCTGPTPTPNRRLMDVALLNCGALATSPTPVQSNQTDIPVAAFGTFFLTLAPPTAGQVKPYAEFRGILKRGSGKLYDSVQLVR